MGEDAADAIDAADATVLPQHQLHQPHTRIIDPNQKNNQTSKPTPQETSQQPRNLRAKKPTQKTCPSKYTLFLLKLTSKANQLMPDA
jgi:hypothetical protein